MSAHEAGAAIRLLFTLAALAYFLSPGIVSGIELCRLLIESRREHERERDERKRVLEQSQEASRRPPRSLP